MSKEKKEPGSIVTQKISDVREISSRNYVITVEAKSGFISRYYFASYTRAKYFRTLLVLIYEQWSYRWIGRPVGYLLNKREREEWFGDLLEIQDLMIKEDRYPVFVINLIISMKTLLLVGSKLRSMLTDVVSKVIQ